MSTRSERDKSKAQQERHQMILSGLLKDEDNKYCVDCDAKGPRWASWNLGVFLCIRCAGIHRNLGVHISKVKSVNLDTWTPEQVAMVQEISNSRGRAVYEANLPDHFRRPQTDSALEAFIRSKYEQKKYQADGWVPPKPTIQLDEHCLLRDKKPVEEPKKEKKKTRPRPATSSGQLPPVTSSGAVSTAVSRPMPAVASEPPAPVKEQSNIDDLLGLDAGSSGPSSGGDLFSDFMSAPPPSTGASVAAASEVAASSSAQSDSLTELFPASGDMMAEGKSTKESILALYGSQPSCTPAQQQPVYNMAAPQPLPSGYGMQQQQVANGSLQQASSVQQQQQQMYNMYSMQQSNIQQLTTQQQNMQQQAWCQQGVMASGMTQRPQQAYQQQMYNMYQQPNNMQQVGQQMGNLNLSGATTNGAVYPQVGVLSGGWQAQPQGQTLATNLWQ